MKIITLNQQNVFVKIKMYFNFYIDEAVTNVFIVVQNVQNTKPSSSTYECDHSK